MIWLTADLHLGHTNVLRHRLGFRSIKQHDRTIIRNINERVSMTDDLWILGDVAFRVDSQQVAEYMHRINCRNIHLVRGNHDKDWHAGRALETERGSVACPFVTTDNLTFLRMPEAEMGGVQVKVTLCHYPLSDWPAHGSGRDLMLHGHIHSAPARADGSFDEPTLDPNQRHGIVGWNAWNRAHGLRRYDVGVDANGYAPVTVAEVLRFFEHGI